METKPTSVCMTGITGFVGKNLWDYLNESSFLLRHINLRKQLSLESLAESDAVVHLAGKAHDIKNVSDDKAYYDINFELTKTLFDFFIQSDASTFIFISSVKAAKDVVENILLEDDFPEPITAYGKSKLMAETYLLAKLPPTKRVYILRPCMIHGQGNKGNLNLLYRTVEKRIPYALSAFENKRSYLSIQNLSFVIKEMLQREDIPDGIYNIADDIPLSTNRVVEIIGESIGIKPVMWKINKNIIRFFARLGDLLKLPFTTERLQKLTENYVVSNAKLLNALKKGLPVGSEEGLKRTFRSFKKE